MPRNLPKTHLALVFFTLTLLLSIAGRFVAASIFHPTYFVDASKLDYEPDQSVSLENPNDIVLQAINNSHQLVEVKAFEDTQIYGLRFTNNPLIVKYDGNYYDITFAVADKFPPAGLPQMLLAGIAVSIIALVALGAKTISAQNTTEKPLGAKTKSAVAEFF